jgi:hypothetical protein
MTRFVDDTFQPAFFPTIGVDFKVRTLVIDDYQCKVQIWLVKFFFLSKENLENL